MMNQQQAVGLYNPRFEHDACGIGAVVDIQGRKSHQTVSDALTIVERLEHRAGKDAEGKTGDGVGILLQISHKFFSKVAEELNISIGGEREYGVGMFFFPQDEHLRTRAMKLFELVTRKEGLAFLAWRKVPVDPDILGSTARDCMPAIWQCFIKKPAKVSKVVADEEAKSMDVTVDEENLAIAIGRGGQNVRLASELTGWQINIMTAEEANKKQEEEDRVACEEFMTELDMSQEDAAALVQDGIYSLEELAYVPEQEIVELGIFDEATVADLRERARRVLLARALKREENLRQADASLLELEGMDHDLASRLVGEGVKTADDLADLDTEELMEKGGIGEEDARALIMAARARWTEE